MNANSTRNTRIAYFSMEIALDPTILPSSGGLGILAGDTLRSAADIQPAMVAITLGLDQAGHQTEEVETWPPETRLESTDATAAIVIDGRTVQIRDWRFNVIGLSQYLVPVYLLDTDLPA